MSRVLVIDDDTALLEVCRVGLTAMGHKVSTARTGTDGLAAAAVRRPDVIVLDLGLPDVDGLEVCRRVRRWDHVPIVVLSADASEERIVAALEQGACDYITKPFRMRELNARLKVVRRHHESLAKDDVPGELVIGPLRLDLANLRTTINGRSVDLTPKEFEFLAYLAKHTGMVCTRKMILENVWGPAYSDQLSYLKVYAYRIRRKLGDETGRLLQSDPVVGYRLVEPD